MVNRLRLFWRAHPALIALLIVVSGTAVAIQRSDAQGHAAIAKVDKETQARFAAGRAEALRSREAICGAINEGKNLFTGVLAVAAKITPPPATTAEARQRAEQTRVFNESIAPLLKPLDCVDFANHPEKYLPPVVTAVTSSTTSTTEVQR